MQDAKSENGSNGNPTPDEPEYIKIAKSDPSKRGWLNIRPRKPGESPSQSAYNANKAAIRAVTAFATRDLLKPWPKIVTPIVALAEKLGLSPTAPKAKVLARAWIFAATTQAMKGNPALLERLLDRVEGRLGDNKYQPQKEQPMIKLDDEQLKALDGILSIAVEQHVGPTAAEADEGAEDPPTSEE